jgi:hypothetical protein
MAISCGHVSIPVHRIILCSASPYFESALPGMLRVYSISSLDKVFEFADIASLEGIFVSSV